MRRLKTLMLGCLLVTTAPTILAAAPFVLLTENPQQGSLIMVKVVGEGQVFVDGKRLERTADNIVVFGAGRDDEALELVLLDKQNQHTLPIQLKKRDWNIERVNGLAAQKVNPTSAATLNRIANESQLVKAARETASKHDYFKAPFISPAKGRISGVYGSQRVLNGTPKRPHYGLDIANKTGTPVVAPVNGVVTLVHNDMFFSGGTLILDHGHGISSSYIHLSKIDVKVGERVNQGQKIAEIGATGRASGPHLDWRLNWFNTRLDPQLLLKQNKDSQ